MPSRADALVHLNERERDAVLRYLSLLIERLGGNLREIWLFGSAARGDMWSARSPMHSDVDLLVLTDEPVPEEVVEALGNATYPLFLECGRQIGPQFRTRPGFHAPETERAREFRLRVEQEGRLVYRPDESGA